VIISFSSTARIPLWLPHGKPLPCSEDHVMLKSDGVLRALLLKTTHKLQSSTIALIKIIETFVGKGSEKERQFERDLCINGLMVIPSCLHHSHYSSWMRNQ